MIQDADFEYSPNDVPALLKPLLDDEADIVYGSRFKQNSPQVHRTYHYFVNRFLTVLSNLFSGIYLTDMETCYKLFRADLIKSMNLTSRRFEIEVELTAYIAKTSARCLWLGKSSFTRGLLYHPPLLPEYTGDRKKTELSLSVEPRQLGHCQDLGRYFSGSSLKL